MIEWISSWAQGIVVAVIVGTIIEMILPEGNNKKYIKTIIGVYILFTITVPVINKFTKEPLKFDISKYEEYLQASYEVENVEEKVNTNIENVYKKNLEEDIKEKIKEKKYEVVKIELDLEFTDSNQYGNINKISLNIKKKEDENQVVKKVETIEIGTKKIEEELEEAISSQERTNLKKYLAEQYEINEENIIIF